MSNQFFETYRQHIGAISYALFLLLGFSLAFPWHITQPIILAWLIAWILEGRWMQRENLRFTRGQHPIWMAMPLIIFSAISIMWSINPEQGNTDLQKYLSLCGLLPVGLWGYNQFYRSVHMKIAIYLGCLVSLIAYTTAAYGFFCNTLSPTYTWWYPPKVWEILGQEPVASLKHRLYYCILLCMALCFSADIYQYLRKRYTRPTTLVTIAIADGILVTGIVFTGSRTCMLLLPLLLIVACFYNIKGKTRVMTILGSVLFILIGGGVFVHHNERIQQTISECRNINMDSVMQHPLAQEPRIYLHSTVLKHVDQYGVKGLGLGSSRMFMVQCYEQDNFPELVELGYGPHSQYLHTWMELGPIALIWMIAIMGLAPFCYKGKIRRDAIFLTIIFAEAMLTETVISRMSGLYILLTALLLLLLEERENVSEE